MSVDMGSLDGNDGGRLLEIPLSVRRTAGIEKIVGDIQFCAQNEENDDQPVSYEDLIDNEEYGEALSLAQAYGLDSDLVYQRQWRKSTVSIASIQDYLEILGGSHAAEQRYDAEFFKKFRNQNIVLSARTYARSFCSTDSPSSSASQRPPPHEYAILLPEECLQMFVWVNLWGFDRILNKHYVGFIVNGDCLGPVVQVIIIVEPSITARDVMLHCEEVIMLGFVDLG
ncbi:Neuroblastoma-amplified sequence [Acipenser ruthenus]|uniref:Neuroblastoma-amplified sequence n=1 Tax=Acipenser ruthenus TaxID=7906 RepID=A0A444UPA5_ACIRT|nr:Neuroblastoma-amplified sequence [Acipenser ruthenus]